MSSGDRRIERREIVPRGLFSLRASAEFGFGHTTDPAAFAGSMRLAFPVDGGVGHAGVILRRREADGPVDVELHLAGAAEAERALAQAARIVSLDGDGGAFAAVGERDERIGMLQRAHPGQRPVLFQSPYEGTAWSIVSARRPAPVAARSRAELSGRLGVTFSLDGENVPSFPQAAALAELDEATGAEVGLNAVKVGRLRAVARAALAGELDVERLHALGPERAYEDVQRLPGIGPFYAGLIVLRASGFADAMLAMAEPKVLAHAGRLYGLGGAMALDEFRARAEAWRPFRTWTTVLIRLAGDRGTF
jgi:DNA-3-methyladenine glycosylase II